MMVRATSHSTDSVKAASTRLASVLMVTFVAIFLAGCATDDPDQQSSIAGNSQTATTSTTTEATATTEPEPTTATEAPPEPSTTTTTKPAPEPQLEGERLFEPLPFRDDPCSNRILAGQHEYSMLLEDAGAITELPLLVHVLPEVVEAGTIPALVIDFHANEFPSTRSISVSVQGVSDARGGAVFVNPIADTTAAAVWSKSATYNTNVISQLWDEIDRSICFSKDDVVWAGNGDGTRLVVEALCETDLPMTYAFLQWGLHFREGCAPSRPVPIEASGNVFTSFAGGSPHWDGPYTPPNRWEAATGIYDPAPVALDRWAELYNCTDERLEQDVPDPEDQLERDSVVFTYTQCDAPLLAAGMQVGSAGFAPDLDALATLYSSDLLDRWRDAVSDFGEQQ